MVSLPAVGPGVGLITGTPHDFPHKKGFSQKELAQTAVPVDLSWQTAVMDIAVQNELVPHTGRFKVEAQSHHTSGSPAAARRDDFPTPWMEAAVPVELSSEHHHSHSSEQRLLSLSGLNFKP